ncbi:antibiotic biosynthesis monooxygenase (ABM) superfamily enzyme [Fictibacillus halophilus]|uniref:Antibiotic biosynthesis monooxygenase (ABM) superfamily enzyme n=1 Tax=Fictibacillus halophilus TaxID=1610490 RepID=A0ABV2LFK0_9BACL
MVITKKYSYSITFTLWLMTVLYFLYKYSSGAGYWKNPLLLSIFFYILMIVLNKGFDKNIIYLSLFYILFLILFILELFFSLKNLAIVHSYLSF